MGLLLDVVPNHMGIGNDSHWWGDVLENGRSSRYAQYFDIDWTPLKSDMRGKLLLPILGKQYGEELESKHIQLALDNGVIQVHYFDHSMPLTPQSLPLIFNGDRRGPEDTYRVTRPSQGSAAYSAARHGRYRARSATPEPVGGAETATARSLASSRRFPSWWCEASGRR